MYLLVFLLLAVAVVLILFAFSGSLFTHKGKRGVKRNVRGGASSASLQKGASNSPHGFRKEAESQKTRISSTNGAKGSRKQNKPRASRAPNDASVPSRAGSRAADASSGSPTSSETDGVKSGCCPLCGTPLVGGEQIKSVVFQGGKSEDRLCHINGCPHCLPPESPAIRRICPVCRKSVPQNGHLVTRMFKRKNGAHHVHILGCTECHKKN